MRDKALQRGLIEACSGIITNCYDASLEVGTLLDESEQAVFAISPRTSGRDFTPTRELLDTLLLWQPRVALGWLRCLVAAVIATVASVP